MKIQYLAVIFILIIMPIIIVFGEYLNTQITLIDTEAIYDERLLDATYDTIKAFQLNTINTTYYTPQVRIANIDAAVNIFFNSLTTAFKYDGNKANTMKEYVPAVVFAMYDGYFIYSPFENTLTNISDKDEDGDGVGDEIDKEYKDGITINGLKPYVSYSCKYKHNGKEYVITYSLDNYIIVDIFEGNSHIRRDGYLLDVEEHGTNYCIEGTGGEVYFSRSNPEKLSEIIPKINRNDDDGSYYFETNADGSVELARYYYTIRDGTKYYYFGNNTNGETPAPKDSIIYIANDGTPTNQVNNYQNNQDRFMKYYEEIFKNNTGYQYYKEAYEFTEWFFGEGLGDLTTDDIDPSSSNYAGYKFVEINGDDRIFKKDGIEESDSNFNRHRADVIRAVITTNLSTAISGFSNYSNTGEEFLMPKISETDWELLENNICIATFFQGMRVGGKSYNNYAVVPNNFNKEYVDENDIYILKSDNTYARANDSTLTSLKTGLTYSPGVLKINFERRLISEGNGYYNPLCSDDEGKNPYLASYTSISGNSGINSIATSDMYKYMKGLDSIQYETLKQAYFIALGRERKGSFKYTINDIES